MRLFANASYKFLEQRKRAYVLSSVIITAGLIAMIVNIATLGSWLNYGVDFTGGSVVQVAFSQTTSPNDVRTALGGGDAQGVTQFGGENVYLLRLPLEEGATVEEVSERVQGQLASAYGADAFEVERTELVSPIVGEELQTKALLATLLTFVLTLIYLAIRFELRFGIAAVIATLHDILLTLSFIAIFRVEMMLPTIAAILTIVGYSLNDTIVVFDRIRENMHAKGARKADQFELINRSLNETLPRTVMTGISVLVTLLALLVFGPLVLRDFSLVMFLGIIAGTYSSLWVASPALIEIRRRIGDGTGTERRKRAETATV
jgi:preprotein translocase subunit SecF